QTVGRRIMSPCGLCQFSSLLEATFLGCGAPRSSSLQNTERTAAISFGRWDAFEAEHRPTSALDATMVLLEAIVEIAVRPVPHATTELRPDRPGIGVVAVCRDTVGDHAGRGLC